MKMVSNVSILRFSLVLLFNLFPWTGAEVFTAVAELERLLETHEKILSNLDCYINKEEQRLTILKRHLDLYKKEHEKAMEDIPNYLGNPINAFTLIKRLTTDLEYIEDTIKIGTEYIKNVTLIHEGAKYPTLEDLTGTALALTRLKETYFLDVEELAEGKLNGVVYSTPMTAGHCYELGRILHKESDYNNALAWMRVALRKYTTEDIGDIKQSLEWTRMLLAIDPNHTEARNNISEYQNSIDEEEARLRQEGEKSDTDSHEEQKISPQEWTDYEDKKSYDALCRGDIGIPNEVSKRLTCRYLTENHPFLKLAPIKMEMMYLDPDIVLFHDVISDDEIQQIKELATPKLKRAVVNDVKTGELVPANYRINKLTWLRNNESATVERISRRVSDMTGLSMDTAEMLQVANYGIGGHYVPHYDFGKKSETSFFKFGGNRIATVLFYMSDVAQGGATVFTELGLSIFPVKGAAAFWFNLHPSGEGDLATRHAACPVLSGSKWVSTKWIHQGGQELLRPCNLEYQEEGIFHKIPQPMVKTIRSQIDYNYHSLNSLYKL